MSKIAIIGSGVIGKATGLGLIEAGHEVTFVDIKEDLIKNLNQEGHQAVLAEDLDVNAIQAFFLTVLTPTVKGEIVLDYLKKALENLGRKLKAKKDYCLIVGRSTMPPQTTEELIIPMIEKYSGKKYSKDFGVCMNPEYLREISSESDFKNPWVIVIGTNDDKSYETLKEIYANYECPVYRLSFKAAEMQKYVHNLFNAAKISFFNEMRMVGEKVGFSDEKMDEIFKITAVSSEGIWNKMYGLKNYGAFGGSCLPKDTKAFSTFAKKRYNFKTKLLDQVIEVNDDFKAKKK
jgi:UDPglucose 6-dehydrogenase